MKGFIAFCIRTLFLVMVEIIRGFIIAIMWNWFIVPLGVPSIGICLGTGLSLIADLLMLNSSGSKGTRKEKEVFMDVLKYLVSSFVLLGLGAIVHLFI